MSYDALIGILIGSGISILVTYITHRFTEKREIQKIDIEREKEAISEIYSPLVFVLDKTRNLFVGIVALHNTFEKMSETKEKPEEAVFILNYLTLENSRSYPQVLEDLLMHKSGLIESRQFYADLVVFQSYLSTIVSFLGMLVLRSNKNPIELKRYLSALAPLIIQLDEAISKMRQYSLAKTTRLSIYEYNQYFTEEKYSELEGYIDEVNKAMTGQYVLDWPLPIKQLIRGKIDKKTRKKLEDKK